MYLDASRSAFGGAMNRARWAAVATAAAAVTLAGPAVLAASPSSASHGAFASKRCSEYYTFHYDVGAGHEDVHWTDNTCNWWIRPFAHCKVGREAIIYTGRWVQADGTSSNANCTASFPALTGGGVDKKNCSTCSYTRTWKWGN